MTTFVAGPMLLVLVLTVGNKIRVTSSLALSIDEAR